MTFRAPYQSDRWSAKILTKNVLIEFQSDLTANLTASRNCENKNRDNSLQKLESFSNHASIHLQLFQRPIESDEGLSFPFHCVAPLTWQPLAR